MSCDLLEQVCPDARWQGTTQVLFAEGKFNACNPSQYPTEFKDLKTVSAFSLQQEPEIEERYKYVCGKKEIADQVIKENGFDFQTTLMDLTKDNLKLLFRGKDAEAIAQPALAAQAIDNIDFSGQPSSTEKLYFLTDSSGGQPRSVYSVTGLVISDNGVPLVEGTDYVFRKSIGAVKFLTVQNALLSVEVTAEQTNVIPIDLGGRNTFEGFVRVLYYPSKDTIGDQCEPEIIIDAVGFISFEDELGMGVDDASEAAMKFSVSGTPRLTDLRVLS